MLPFLLIHSQIPTAPIRNRICNLFQVCFVLPAPIVVQYQPTNFFQVNQICKQKIKYMNINILTSINDSVAWNFSAANI